MNTFLANAVFVLSEVDASDGVATPAFAATNWIKAPEGRGFSAFYKFASAGTPTVAITMRASPIAVSNKVTAFESTPLQNPDDFYEDITVASGLTKTDKGKWLSFTTYPNFQILDRPIGQVQFQVTPTGAAITDFYLILCCNVG